MRVGVVLAGEMMAIIRFARREFFEPCHDILPESRFVVVYEDARSNVHRTYQHDAVSQSGVLTNALHEAGNIPNFVPRRGRDRLVFRMSYEFVHGAHFCHAQPRSLALARGAGRTASKP